MNVPDKKWLVRVFEAMTAPRTRNIAQLLCGGLLYFAMSRVSFCHTPGPSAAIQPIAASCAVKHSLPFSRTARSQPHLIASNPPKEFYPGASEYSERSARGMSRCSTQLAAKRSRNTPGCGADRSSPSHAQAAVRLAMPMWWPRRCLLSYTARRQYGPSIFDHGD